MNYLRRIEELIDKCIDICGSQQELSKELGLTPSTISHWKAERKNPSGVSVLMMQDLIAANPDGGKKRFVSPRFDGKGTPRNGQSKH